MTELEKIAYAKTYIEKLANGINPLTDQPVPDSDSINNVRISRCLFYVSDILRHNAVKGCYRARQQMTAVLSNALPKGRAFLHRHNFSILCL